MRVATWNVQWPQPAVSERRPNFREAQRSQRRYLGHHRRAPWTASGAWIPDRCRQRLGVRREAWSPQGARVVKASVWQDLHVVETGAAKGRVLAAVTDTDDGPSGLSRSAFHGRTHTSGRAGKIGRAGRSTSSAAANCSRFVKRSIAAFQPSSLATSTRGSREASADPCRGGDRRGAG